MMNATAHRSNEVTAYNFDENYGKYINATDSLANETNLINANATESYKIASIFAPNGWNRILDNGAVVYISPNKSRLRSMEDVRSYMMSATTCKCGLECPFQLEKVFSFSPNIATSQILHKRSNFCECNVDIGFQQILLQFTSEKLARLTKKGTKKKKKRSKTFDKDGRKKLHHTRKGQKPNSIENVPSTESAIIKESTADSVVVNKILTGNEAESFIRFSTNNHFKNHIASYSQMKNAFFNHLSSANVKTNINGDPVSNQVGITNIAPQALASTNTAVGSSKAAPLKSASKKGLTKSKRIPKSKEDLTIASMMGRVKQQVGDLDKVRTAQMFTLPHQPVSRQESRTANAGDKKTNFLMHNSLTSTAASQGSEFNKSTVGSNLIETKGPPNITLPLSHSNMLPQAVAKSLNYPISSALQNITAVSHSSGPKLESQPLAVRQDPHLFSGKASTNVYWGRDEQISSKDVHDGPESRPNVINNNKTTIPQEPSVKETVRGLNIAKDLIINKTSLAVTDGSAKSETTFQVSGHPLLKETSAPCVNVNETSIQRSITNLSKKPIDTSYFVFNNAGLSKQQNVSAEPVANDHKGATNSDQIKVMSKGGRTFVDETGIKNVLNSLPTSSNKDSLLTTMSSTIVNKSPKGTPTTFSTSVKESISPKPLQTQNTVTVATAPVSTASQPQQPEVVSFQNVYGVSNPANLVKGTVAATKTSSTGNNPARFLIMGSQASQALQHLALQQSNTLQVSLQRTENSQGMYLQTLSSYNPASHNPSHGTIGFAYANVPIHLMTVGGTQVVGKQQPAQPFNFERYSNFYRYYQDSRQFEGAANEHGAQVQAASLMYPGINPANQPAGSYIRIAPASVAGNKIPLPVQVMATQPQSSQSVLDESHQMPTTSAPSNPITTMKLTVTSTTASSSTNTPSSSVNTEKVPSSSGELKRKLTVSEEAVEGKKKQSREGGGSSQHAFELNSTAQTLTVSTPLSGKSLDEARSQERMLPETESIFRPQAFQPSTVIGAFSGRAENRDGSNLSGIAVLKNEARHVDVEGKSTNTLQTVGTGMDSAKSHPGIGSNTDPVEIKIKDEEQEELNLNCNEPCNNASDSSRTPTPEMSVRAPIKQVNQQELNLSPVQSKTGLKIGDLIWGHQKGYSAWPGKIVSAFEVKENSTENGKVWIKWFGEHTHSQMDLKSLKSLAEGLREYRNSKRRKNRTTKKTVESLEAAITEALNVAKSKAVT